ncbi:MAG: DUF4347 domain-containing protein [Acetobacter orientalis]|uniref:DUF4347 domain-containing protein n=1 Tax=Acetobacter orientalis TaxID=146474 RepID=UPI0039ECF58B
MRRVLEPRRVFEGHALNHEHHAAAPVGEHKAVEETHNTTKIAQKQTDTTATVTDSTKNTAHSIAFIDTSVSNWQVLANSLEPNTEIVKIAPGTDALAQMTKVIAQENNIETISIISYGQQGSLSIGSGLDVSSLTKDSASVSSWSEHMAKDGQILLWGCDAGAGASGTQLVDTLHTLTKADVAANQNPTGDSAEGGDWTLESKSGDFTVHDVFATQVASLYDTVLDKPQPVVSFESGQANSVLVGDTFTETVNFTNAASTAVGYSPYVAFVVPKTDGASVSVSSISYLGTDLTKQAGQSLTETVSPDGTVLNPYSVDSSGKATSITVSGAKVGDQVVFVKLPFGSYSPGQPAAAVTATFKVDNTTKVADNAISVSAFGGFTLGADALNNPSSDPSITSATVANTVVSTTLVSVETTADTTHGEGETATGKDFPVTYNTVITPATATAGDALNNFTTTITLPPDVILSGDTTPAGGKVFTQDEVDAAVKSNVIQITGNGINPTGATFTPGTTPGTIIVTFPTLQSAVEADGSHPNVTVAIKTYIGQTGADGTSILGDNGASKQITAPTVTYAANQWTQTGQSDTATTVEGKGDSSSALVTAKAFALQTTARDVTQSNGKVLPNDTINYTTSMQVSDYGSAKVDENFVVTQTLSDGQTILPNTEPTFTDKNGNIIKGLGTIDAATTTTTTLNGETVYTSGSNDYWSFSRDENTGKTVVKFNIGKAIADGTLDAGAVNGLTFQAKALSAYTPKSGDTTTRVITEQDALSSDVTGSVTLNTLNDKTAAKDTLLSDTSGTQLTVPTGKAQIEIVAVNGNPVTTTTQDDGTSKLTYADGSAVLIKPNDQVTYASTYALQSGDYNNLTLTSYLPQGTFSTTNPTESASSGSTFTAAGTESTGYPKSGEYKLVSAPNGVSIVGTPTTDATSNNLGFTFSQNTSPSAGTPVTVEFTVTASNAAMVNGLPLTALVQGTLTNGSGTTVSDQRIVGTTLAEPSLNTTTGIVSVVDDTGTSKTVDYTNGSTAPGNIFNAAGTDGNAFVNNNDTTANIINANDLNVGTDANKVAVDGGDTVRIATTVKNTGQYDAYDVQVAGDLPSGVTSTDAISHFQVYKRDSNGSLVGVYTDAASAKTAAEAYFSKTGLTLTGDTANGPVLAGTTDSTTPTALFVVYDVTLPTNITMAQTITGVGSILAFSNASKGSNFVKPIQDTNGNITALSDPAGDTLRDTASVDLAKPTINIYTGASDNPDDDHNKTTQINGTDQVTSGNVVVGETRPITLNVNIPEGTIKGADGKDVTVTTTLPDGMNLTDPHNITITLPDGSTLSGSNYTQNGNTLTFDLGSSITNTSADANKPVTITFDTTVADTATGKHAPYDITAKLNYSAGESDANHVNFTQIIPNVTANLTPNVTEGLYSGQTVNYIYTVTNSGQAVAEGVTQTLYLDQQQLQLIKSGAITGTDSLGNTITLTPDLTNNTLSLSGVQLKPGETVTFKFDATVQNDQAAGTQDIVSSTSSTSSYYTMPNGAGHQFTFDASATSTINTFQHVKLSIVGESNGELSDKPSEKHQLPSVETPIGDILRLQGSTDVPEGKTDGVKLTVTLPDGMTIPDLSKNSVTLAFVKPDGAKTDLTSSNFTSADLIQTDATHNKGGPIYTPDSSHVSVSADGKTLTIDLGTLSNNDGIAGTNKVIFEFNAIVSNTQSNTNGKFRYTTDTSGKNDPYDSQGTATQHTATLNVSYQNNDSGITSDGSNSVTQTVVEPHLTLTKDETAFNPSTNTATYTVTVTNNGDAAAHQVVVTDPLTENTTLASNSPNSDYTLDSKGLSATLATLAVGESKTFTYNVTLKDITKAPPIDHTTATYEGLSSEAPQALYTQIVTNDDGTKATTATSDAGASDIIGTTTGTAMGTVDGGRNGDALDVATGTVDHNLSDAAATDHYYAKATSQFSIITGTIYDALGNIDPSAPAYNSTTTAKGAVDHYLPGVKVTYTDPTTGELVSTTTDAQGRFRFAGVPNADVTLSVVTPTGETNVLAYHDAKGTTDGNASVTIKALGGSASSDTQFVYRQADTAPTITGNGVTTSSTPTDVVTVKPNSPTSLLHDTTNLTVADKELDLLNSADSTTYNYGGTVLTVQRYDDAGTPQADSSDTFGVQGPLSIKQDPLNKEKYNVFYNNNPVGEVTKNTNGTLVITLANGTTSADVKNILSNLTYENTNTTQDQKNTRLGITLDDHNDTAQGTGGDQTSTPVFTYFTSLVNTRPGTQYTETNGPNYDSSKSPTDPQTTATTLGFPEITGGGQVTSYTVTMGIPAGITDPTTLAEDRLQVGSTDIGGITWQYDQATRSLTLTGPTTATEAQWNNAITSIGYYNTSDKPVDGARTLDRTVLIDGQPAEVDKNFSSVTVTHEDDSPILAPNGVTATGDSTIPPAVMPEDQAASSAALGTSSGTLVSSFINSNTVTDPDANNLANDAPASSGALPGMAVTATTDTTKGTWYYTTDGGTNWSKVNIANGQALYLVADGSTKICFVPTQTNYNGVIPDALTYRAWDQTDPHDNGSTATLPTGQLGTGTGPEASYSAQEDTLAQRVENINNAPVVKDGQSTLNPTQDENTSAPKTVDTLFKPAFTDPADQQQSAQNPQGSVANDFAGVAITNNAVPTTEGAWQYSTDGGTNWHDVGTVSEKSALVLSNTAQMRFVPTENFNGKPQTLTARLIDNSNTTLPVSGSGTPVTGETLYNSGQALTGVDATQNGGASALSSQTVQLALTVNPVNNAPTASGTAVLVPAKAGDPPASATVKSLFDTPKIYNDTADQQKGIPDRPDGQSSAQDLGGIAITNNQTPATDGTWRYSTDGGTSWHDVGTVSDKSALVLSSDALLQFNPAAGFTGSPKPLGVHLIDGSTTNLATSDGTTVTGQSLLNGTTMAVTGVDTTQRGGTTALSQDAIDLNTHLAPTVKPDVQPGTLNGTEDQPQPSKTVTDLFGQTFSDTTSSFGGIAITSNPGTNDTSLSKAEGTWQYSTDGGTNWHDVGAVSDKSALVLSSDALLKFNAAPNFNGAPPPLQAHLVDNSELPVSGTTTGADIAKGGQAITGVDVSTNGGTTPLSTDVVTLTDSVAPVPDAPTAQGPVALPDMTQDDPPKGDSVADLFGTKAGYSNAADAQKLPDASGNARNPTGTSSADISGVAITGNPTPSKEGSWVYSTDGGTTWVAIPQDVSAKNALILPKDVLIGFKPAHDFNGAPEPLTGRPIAGGPGLVVPGMQGQDVKTVMSNVDISHATEEGAVDLTDVAANVKIIPLLLRPEVTPGTDTLTLPGNGGSVSGLFGDRYDDTRRGQNTDINPTGSFSKPFGGIAITDNPTTPAEGVWRYSTDGGKTWNAIPTGLTPDHAFVVPATAQISFQGSGGYTGSTTLTAHLVREVSNISSYVDIGTGLYGNTSLQALQIKASTVSLPRQSTSTLRDGFSADAMAQPVVDAWIGPYLHPYDQSNTDGWLRGYDTDAFVMVNTQDAVSVNGLFKSSDPASVLSLRASQRDDAPLPNWVTFDAITGTFTVVPPSDAPDSLDLKVEAQDNALRTAQSTVHIVIGRDPMQDLLGTLPTLPDLAAKPVPRNKQGHQPFLHQVHQAVHHA